MVVVILHPVVGATVVPGGGHTEYAEGTAGGGLGQG